MTVFHRPAAPLSGRSDPEDGPDALRMHHLQRDTAPRAITGFACEAGVARNKGRVGAKDAPIAIRNAFAGLAAPEERPIFTDLGDIVVEDNALERGQERLGQHLAQALKNHERIIVLGGGHETAYGSYLGLKTAFPEHKIGIINFDAHLDLRNIGEAGASSGTPFNQIRELNPERFDYLCIGAAKEANTQALFNRASEWGVDIIFDTELRSNIDSARPKIEALIKRSDVLYLTIDIDLLPHYQAPGVSAPAARGVSLSIVEKLLDIIKKSCQAENTILPLIDIVEVSPPHDRDNMTAKTAALLALSLLY